MSLFFVGNCYGPSAPVNDCCTGSTPCGVGEGDCDEDGHCAGSLKCGKDNCLEGVGFPMDTFDCCFQPYTRCYGPSATADGCCTKLNPCEHGEGDCDTDEQCAGSLKCGTNNCMIGVGFSRDNFDCCEKPSNSSGI